MYLKAQYKILTEDNKTEMKNIMVEMVEVSEESTPEEREDSYYTALRKAISILSEWNNILQWGQFEVVDCKVTDGEYNMQLKSTEMQVESNNIYSL